MNRYQRLRNAGIVLFGVLLGLPTPAALAAPVAAKSGPVVVVITCAPGMAASAVEKNITDRIERRSGRAAGVRTTASRSIAGASIIDIVFHDEVDPVLALTQVNSVIQADLARLPANAQRPLATLRPPLLAPRWEDDNGWMPSGVVTVTSPTQGEATLRSAGRIAVATRLLSVPGLVAPVVLGGKDFALVCSLNPAKMEARHLSRREVEIALHRTNRNTTFTGIAIFGDNQFLIKRNAKDDKAGKEIRELLDLPIRSEPDKVSLGDIATIEDTASSATSLLRINGRRGVCLPVYFSATGDEKTKTERIENCLASARERLPHDIKVEWLPFNVPRKEGRSDEKGLLTIHLRTPSNLRLEAVEKRIEAVERFLKENIPAKERLAILAELGVRADLSVAYTSNAGQQDATVRVQLSPDRTRSAGEYARLLRSRFLKENAFADLRIALTASDLPRPFALRIRGGSAEQAAKVARELRNRVTAIDGTADVFVVERQDAPYLVFDVDRAKAAQVGLTQADVFSQAAGICSVPIAPLLSYGLAGGSLPLYVLSAKNSDVDLNDLLTVAVQGTNLGYPIRLSSLMKYRRTTEAVEIHHVDASLVFNVRVGIDKRDRREAIADVRKMLAELKTPAGVRVELVE